MKHKRFEENILVDEAYTNYGKVDKNADQKKGQGIAKHFSETLEHEDRKKWYSQLPTITTESETLSREKIDELRKEANSALHGDTLAYETKSNRSGFSDYQWAKTLLNKGAIGDRVAAATILIQDDPVHNLKALKNLVESVKPAKKKDGIVVIDCLSELFVSELLIPNMKLKTFEQHPLSALQEMSSNRRTVLKLWFYEDQLKELYGTYVEALNKFAHDTVEANKEKAVSAMSYLLMHHPEREKMLLSNIINKLGDPSQAVGSKVVYHLCQLLYNHPRMKPVVLLEIQKMLFRPNISARAQYYGICFLNQFYLHKNEEEIAEELIRIYFSFFKASIKKGEIDSRLMSAILSGVKRAYPFADRDRLAGADAARHTDALHKLVHMGGAGVAVHALALLGQLADVDTAAGDRFYTSLYRKLMSTDVFNTTHSALLFSLIYKSLKRDKDVDRVAAFIKRLLQLACYMSPAQACGILFLVAQVLRDEDKKTAITLVCAKKEVKEEIKDEIEVDQEEKGETQELEESVVEVNKTLDSTEDTVQEPATERKKVDLLHGNKRDLLLDDEEEKYIDLKIDGDGNVKPKVRRAVTGSNPGWYHAKVKVETDAFAEEKEEKEAAAKIQMKKTINMDKVVSSYSPGARNPSHAGARSAAALELRALAAHYHPTVKLFASKLLHEQNISYSGDPLKDFAGIRFLDRFVFKNPRRREAPPAPEGAARVVKGSHPKFALRKNYAARGLKSIPVNSASYLNQEEKNIPVDEKFLYDFLQKRRAAQAPDDDERDSDDESVCSEDFEAYLDGLTGSTAKAESDDELDFLGEMETTKNIRDKKKKKKSDHEPDEVPLGSDEDDEMEGGFDDADGSDGSLDISGDEDEPRLSGDEDELMLEDSDEDDQITVPGDRKGKRKTKLNLKGKNDLGSLFASADEFSTLLEETATSKKQGSSQAVANTDKASVKQLAWEEKRDTWIKGYNKKIHGSKKGNKKFTKNKQNGAAETKGGKRKRDSRSGAGAKKGAKRKIDGAGGAGGKRKKNN